MSDFSDRPFHVGSLVGLRAFKVDALGRLVGPSYGGVFKPGENEAECKKRDEWSLGAMLTPPTTGGSYFVYSDPTFTQPARVLNEAAVESREITYPKHTIAGASCLCGFYGYFDGLNDYMVTGRIAAVIEGYGSYMLGTRGFRASKARLLGLIEPQFGTYNGMYMTGGPVDVMSPGKLTRVKHNYSEVPFYATQDDAIAAHPLHEPELPTPETDPGFWVRSAS